MVALGISAPLDQAAPFLGGFIVAGQAPDDRAERRVDFWFASPNYCTMIGMTLLSGRGDDPMRRCARTKVRSPHCCGP